MIELRFTETMKGYVAVGEREFQRGYEEGKRRGSLLSMRLTLGTKDLDAFLRSRERLLQVEGEISYAPLGEHLAAAGTVNQLIDVAGDRRRKSMPYRLEFADKQGRPFVLSALKTVVNDRGFDSLRDTTNLDVQVLSDEDSEPYAVGIVHIGFLPFLRQFPSYRMSGGSWLDRKLALPRFYGSFLAKLWEVYGLHRRGAP
jgi:cholesterol oxidase